MSDTNVLELSAHVLDTCNFFHVDPSTQIEFLGALDILDSLLLNLNI